MYFKNYALKEAICLLSQENRRLKRENQRLHQSLNELDKYKEEYQKLITQLKKIEKRIFQKIRDF